MTMHAPCMAAPSVRFVPPPTWTVVEDRPAMPDDAVEVAPGLWAWPAREGAPQGEAYIPGIRMAS